MEYRQGICGDCNAEYQLSPTFSADKAKCKKCGGTVDVGPVQERPDPAPTESHTGSSAGASSAPKPKPVPTKSPKPTSSPKAAPPKKVVEVPEEAPRKRREGPTMKEKLLARRKADSEAEGSTETPAPTTRKAQAARPSASSTHPKGAKKTAGSRAGSKSSPGGSSTRRSSTSKSSTRSGTRSKSSRRGEEDDDEGSARPARRTSRKQKSMSPGMMIGSLVVLVVLVIAMFFVMGGDDTVPEENNTDVVAGDTDKSGTETTDGSQGTAFAPQMAMLKQTLELLDNTAQLAVLNESLRAFDEALDKDPVRQLTPEQKKQADDFRKQLVQMANAIENSSGPESLTSGDASDPLEAQDPPTEATAPKEPPAPATETSEIPRNPVTGRFNVWMLSKSPKGATKYPDALYVPNDPAEPKLATFEPFGVPPGVEESEWIEIMDLAGVLIDPDAGAAGTRAAMALEKKGKVAFPALINVMLNLDFADPEGNMAGDMCQRSLMKIANGMNVGWYHDFRQEPNKTAIQNSRCVEVLYEKVWKRELREPGYFERYAKIEEMKKRDDASASEGTDEGSDDELADELDDAFDDL